MKIPIAWVAEMLGCTIGKAQRALNVQGEVELEQFIEYIERRYKHNSIRYGILIEKIDRIERKA